MISTTFAVSILLAAILMCLNAKLTTKRWTQPDFCLLPKEEKCCMPYLMWYYNSETGNCEEFTNGGYGGNANRFMTSDDCIYSCGRISVCSKPPEYGNGKGNFTRYFYDPEKEQCSVFKYSGSGGNINHFDNIEKCNWACNLTVIVKDQGTDTDTDTAETESDYWYEVGYPWQPTAE